MTMSLSGILPWQRNQWETLLARAAANALPHALLFAGPEGLGKEYLARCFSQTLLCKTPENGQACQRCPACLLFNAGTHPDYQHIAPKEEGRAIGIDQMRDMITWISFKSHASGYKIALITPAEQMTIQTANALLKTLEEPPANSLLLLISSRPAALPATVRSRCQTLRFTPPARAAALAWLTEQLGAAHPAESLLTLAADAPLRALSYAQDGTLELRTRLFNDLQRLSRGDADPVVLAAAWLAFDLKQAVHWLSSWITDTLRLQAAAPATISNPDLRTELAGLTNACPARQLYAYLDRLLAAARLLDKPLNAQLVLEDLLISWPLRNSRAV